MGEIVGSRGKVLTASRTRWLKVFSRQSGEKELARSGWYSSSQCGEIIFIQSQQLGWSLGIMAPPLPLVS